MKAVLGLQTCPPLPGDPEPGTLGTVLWHCWLRMLLVPLLCRRLRWEKQKVCKEIPSFNPAGRSRGEEWNQLGHEPWDPLHHGLGIPQDFLHAAGFPLFFPAAFCIFFFALPPEQLLPLWSLFTSVFPALAAAPTGNCVLSFPFCPGVRLGLCLGLFPGEVSGKPQRIFVLEGGGGCSASQMPGISPQNTAGKGTESSLRMPAWQQQWVLVWNLAPKQTQQHLGHGLSWS